MSDKRTRQLINAIFGEAPDLPSAESLPAELVDALRERLRAYDGNDRSGDQNLLAAYLEGKLDQAGQQQLIDRLLTAEDFNSRARKKSAGSDRIGAAPRVYPVPGDEADIAEELREARRWTGRLEKATTPAPSSFTEAVVGMQPGGVVEATPRKGFLPEWLHAVSWRPVASIASVALVFIVGLNLIGPDLQFDPVEGVAPAVPVDREPADREPAESKMSESEMSKTLASPEDRVAPEPVAPAAAEGVEEVIVTGARRRRDELPKSAPDQSGGFGLSHSLDTTEFLKSSPREDGGYAALSTELNQTQIVMEEVFRLGAEGTLAYNEGRFEEATADFERAISYLQPLVPADDMVLVRLTELRDAAVLARDGEDDEPPSE